MSVWTNDIFRFWNDLKCDELWLEFDTSAHSNNGTPEVDADHVVNHSDQCFVCDSSVRVSVSSDGYELEI